MFSSVSRYPASCVDELTTVESGSPSDGTKVKTNIYTSSFDLVMALYSQLRGNTGVDIPPMRGQNDKRA